MPYENCVTLKEVLEYLKNHDSNLDVMNLPILVEGSDGYEPLQLDRVGVYRYDTDKIYLVIDKA